MKHKVIGAVVWVGLAVVILPFFMDGSGVSENKLQENSIAEPQLSLSEPLLLDSVDDSVMQAASTVTEAAALSDADNTALATPATSVQQPSKPVVSKSTSKPAVESTPEPAAKLTPKTTQQAVTKAVEKTSTAPTKISEVISKGYAVQLASFKNKPNALALKEKLIKANYDSFLRTKGEFTQVLVGPTFERLQSQKLQQKLKTEFKLTGFVVTYTKN